MARNRTISQSIALLTGPTPATGAHGSNLNPVWALQSLTYGWTYQKDDVIIYGKGSPLGRESLDPPEVSVQYSYYVTSNFNEKYNCGFTVDGVNGILTAILGGADERNYFVFVTPDGTDAIGSSGATSGVRVYGLGNCFLSSYSLEAAVGSFPTASVEVQGLNVKTYTGGVAQPIPAVDPTTGLEVSTGITFTVPYIENMTTGANAASIARTVLKPGDITVNITNAGGVFMDYSSTCIQSFRLNFDLNRNPINCLGSRYSAARPVNFPINVNFEVEMLAKEVNTGSLAEFLCFTGSTSALVNLRLPVCGTGTGANALGFKLINVSLESQNYNTSAGSDPQTVTQTWIGQIGGPTDLTSNVLMSGTFA